MALAKDAIYRRSSAFVNDDHPDDTSDGVDAHNLGVEQQWWPRRLFLALSQGDQTIIASSARTFGGGNGDAGRQISPSVHILLESVAGIEDDSGGHDDDGRIRLLHRSS